MYIVFILISMVREFVWKQRFVQKHGQAEFVRNVMSHVLTAIGCLLYLVGNHVGLILANYGIFYGCDETCVRIGVQISNTLLITALLLFQLIPPFVNKAKVLTSKKITTNDHHMEHSSNWSPWKTTAQAMGFILQLDTWFTAVSNLPLDTVVLCPDYAINLAWGLYGVGLICWAALLVVMIIPGAVNVIKRPDSINVFQLVLACINLSVIWLISAGLLLGDNIQPLGCVFGCRTDVTFLLDNSTSSECQYETFHATRTTILFIVMISLALMAVGLIVHSHKKRQMSAHTSLSLDAAGNEGKIKVAETKDK